MRDVRHLLGRTGRLLVAAGVLSAVGLSAAGQDTVVREGVGSHRAAMDAMELTKFDASLIEGLTSWSNSERLTAADLAGRPVVIFTWANWVPASNAAVAVAQRLHERHAEEGLLVIGVHPEQATEGIAPFAERRKATFPMAVDAGGKLRAALQVDQDPDFYLIDRAGQIRFADVQTTSVEEGARVLLAEDAESAAGIQARLAAEKARLEAEARRTRAIREDLSLTNLPEIPFTEPTAREYERAAWPTPPRVESRGRNDEGQKIPRAFPLPEFHDRQGRVAPRAGRATVLYFWTPMLRSSYDPMMRMADQLQDAYERDILVVGVMSAWPDDRRDQSGKAMDTAERDAAFIEFQRAAERRHILFKDKIVEGGRNNRGAMSELLNALGVQPQSGSWGPSLPYIAIISSDGQLRWHGPGRNFERARAALDQVLRVDPGIRNRRAAEQAYIRERLSTEGGEAAKP